ncbi:MAG: TetR/AcrR family transcriptional regulator [Burkholderiaceae bacterium]|nr:TetR/AcrR family transcriptional regulator [Burkholderiaceae bacterium]
MTYLSRSKRVAQIIEGATKFFSEHGLGGQTRELSASLGIAQPLLYRYFPSKQALIDRIFIEAFENRWDDSWRDLILDESQPLKERYKRFYAEFNDSILTREWVRLFMYAELGSYGYGKKVLDKLRKEIFLPLAITLRKHYGYPQVDESAITKAEIELLLELHGVVLYHAIRRHVYDVKASRKIGPILDNIVFYLEGAMPRVLANLFPDHRPTAARMKRQS